MDVSVQSLKRVELVTVNGRVDSSSAPRLEETLQQYMENGRYKFVLNLAGVDYMSSAGLRVLVATMRECRRHSGDVRLAASSPRVQEVLKLAGLDIVVKMFEDNTTAVGSY